jgi:hypothetical protein
MNKIKCEGIMCNRKTKLHLKNCKYYTEIKNNIPYCGHNKCLSLNDNKVQFRYLVKCTNSQYCIHHYDALYQYKYICHIEELNSGRIVCYDQHCTIEDKNHHKSKNINNINRICKCNINNCELYAKYQGVWNKWYCENHYNGLVCNLNGCTITKQLEYKHKAWYCQKHLILQK